MPIVPIIVGLLFLGGIVALFLSGPTWRWYHITMVALIMVLSLGWFYLAARTLKIQDTWRTQVTKWEAKYRDAEKQREQLLKGPVDDKPHLPFAKLKDEVDKILQGRGRVWGERPVEGQTTSSVTRKAVAPDGRIAVTVEKPNPSGIEKGMMLWVFDGIDATQNGQFLGEFEVIAVNGQEVQLAPALKLRATELTRIAQRRTGPLILYEVMPTDTRDLLRLASNMLSPEEREKRSDAELLAMHMPRTVPEAVRLEYLKDGKPPAAGEPSSERVWRRVKAVKEFVVPLSAAEAKARQDAGQMVEKEEGTEKPILKIAEGTILDLDPKSAEELLASRNVEPLVGEDGQPSDKVYMRELRDYARLYRDWNMHIEGLLRTTAEVDRQNAAVQEAIRKVTADFESREREKGLLEADKARIQNELQLVRNLVTGYQGQIAALDRSVNEVAAENARLENQLSTYTRQAVDLINQKSALARQRGN